MADKEIVPIAKDLSIEEDNFCLQYVLTSNNGSEAARRAFAEQHYNDSYIRAKACVLLAKPSIQERIEWHKKIEIAKLGLSEYSYLAKTLDLQAIALKEGDIRSALYAQTIIGKALFPSGQPGAIKSLTSSPEGAIKIEFTQGDE
jgi:hypothetical protein